MYSLIPLFSEFGSWGSNSAADDGEALNRWDVSTQHALGIGYMSLLWLSARCGRRICSPTDLGGQKRHTLIWGIIHETVKMNSSACCRRRKRNGTLKLS